MGAQTYDKVLLAQGVDANNSIALHVPAEGHLRKLIVKQNGGVAGALTVNLYNSIAALTSGEPEPYKVIPTQSITSGAAGELFGDYPYHNQDGSFTLPQRLLYLVITGGSSTPKYDIGVSIDPSAPR